MKISGLSCITKKIFLVFLGHPKLPPEDSVACVQVQEENPGGGGEVLHQPDHPGLELPPLEAHPSQRLEAGQHVSLRTDGG